VLVGVDVAVDGHRGDGAGGGDLGHGELPGVVHPLGLADEAGDDFGFAAPLVTAAAGGDESGLGALVDQPGLVFGHQGVHAEDEFAVAGGVDDAKGSRDSCHRQSTFGLGRFPAGVPWSRRRAAGIGPVSGLFVQLDGPA